MGRTWEKNLLTNDGLQSGLDSQPHTEDCEGRRPEDTKTYYSVIKGSWPVSLRIDKNEAIISRILNILLKYSTKIFFPQEVYN